MYKKSSISENLVRTDKSSEACSSSSSGSKMERMCSYPTFDLRNPQITRFPRLLFNDNLTFQVYIYKIFCHSILSTLILVVIYLIIDYNLIVRIFSNQLYYIYGGVLILRKLSKYAPTNLIENIKFSWFPECIAIDYRSLRFQKYIK